jgi:hypothetical protein
MTCSCGNPRCMMAGSSQYHVAQYELNWWALGAFIAIVVGVILIGVLG